MKVTGIIAEYNPFHNGHQYQIEQARKQADADYVIVVMSGDFVQRGAPALVDKYTRTHMALSCGADLVLELPVLWACASAEYFASAGVALLDHLGVIDSICFGCETPDSDSFFRLAGFLSKEPDSYRLALTDFLKSGMNYPKARTMALRSSMPDFTTELEEILNSPNNILGLEYHKALTTRQSSIKPLPILRIGKGYHSLDTDCSYASATSIRTLLQTQTDLYSDLSALSQLMPPAAFDILQDALMTYPLLFEDDFSSFLGYQLLKTDSFFEYADSSIDLSNRIQNTKPFFVSISSYLENLKTKEVTYTRLSRLLLHILLDIKEKDYDKYRNLDYVSYARVLGFKESATPLMRKLKENCKLPLITTLSQSSKFLNESAINLLQKDILASNLYRLAAIQKSGFSIPDEYHRKFLKL